MSAAVPRVHVQRYRQRISGLLLDRILKVARTIAALKAAPQINATHLSEAIQYRTLDRNLWG